MIRFFAGTFIVHIVLFFLILIAMLFFVDEPLANTLLGAALVAGIKFIITAGTQYEIMFMAKVPHKEQDQNLQAFTLNIGIKMGLLDMLVSIPMLGAVVLLSWWFSFQMWIAIALGLVMVFIVPTLVVAAYLTFVREMLPFPQNLAAQDAVETEPEQEKPHQGEDGL